MNPYILFSISGITDLGISGGKRSFPLHSHLPFTALEFLLNQQKITQIKLELSPHTRCTNEIVVQATSLLKLFMINIIGHWSINPQNLQIRIIEVYDPAARQSSAQISFAEPIKIGEKFSTFLQTPINQWAERFPLSFISSEKNLLFEQFYQILQLDNLAFRYLTLYEFLRSQIGSKPSQKKVTSYIKNTYNPAFPESPIAFKPTTRPESTRTEDELTFFRNLLAHQDYTHPSNYDETTLVHYNKKLIGVIYYVLTH